MTSSLLDSLTHANFQQSVGFILPPRAFRRVLLKNKTVRLLDEAIRVGQITEQAVRDFASSQAIQYKVGESLPGDIALAALAVALESNPAHFAEEYLCDLARLHLPEMATSTRIARECWKERCSLPKNEIKNFIFPALPVMSEHTTAGSQDIRTTLRPLPSFSRTRTQYDTVQYGAKGSANATA